VRIFKVPLIGGIAYIRWGPCWKLHGEERMPEILQLMVKALKNEYVTRRGLFLRILPNEIEGDEELQSVFKAERFQWKPSAYRTLIIDLAPSLEVLRRNLAPRWRTDLNRAEKNGLTVIEGTNEELYDLFSSIYKEMHARKKFVEFVPTDQYQCIQKNLPEALKMKIMVSKVDGEPIAATVTSLVGDTAHAIFWATNNLGRKMKGAYILQWRIIEALKARGCCYYDLCGINREQNPGSYRFKAGLAGKNGKEIRNIGQFDMCENLNSFVLVKTGDFLRTNYRKIKYMYNKLVHQ